MSNPVGHRAGWSDPAVASRGDREPSPPMPRLLDFRGGFPLRLADVTDPLSSGFWLV